MGEIPFLTPLSRSSANEEHFRLLDNSQMLEIVPRLQVLARSSPENQKILVEKLRPLGEIVGVTGDSTDCWIFVFALVTTFLAREEGLRGCMHILQS
jgi:hypothetical protein